MDIKSRNRNIALLFFCIILLGVSLISVMDIIINQSNFTKDKYTKTGEFENLVGMYMNSALDLSTTYKDFDNKAFNEKEEKYYGYSKALNQIGASPNFKYYFKDRKSKEVYTNIQNLSDIKKYIKSKSVYHVNFNDGQDAAGGVTPYYEFTKRIDTKYDAYFIVPKMSKGQDYYVDSINYSNLIRNRLVKELKIIPFTLFLGFGIYIFLFHFKRKNPTFGNELIKSFRKIPMDLRIIFFVIFTILFGYSYGSIDFFNTLNMNDYLEILFAALYSLYAIAIIESSLKMINQKGEFAAQFKKSMVFIIISELNNSLRAKSVFIKIALIFVMTFIFSFKLMEMCNTGIVNIYDLLIVISYISFVPFYIINRIAYINKIIVGSKEIASGNFRHEIAVKDKSMLGELADNINNIKIGYENSIEEQIKSERFKAELITNVSHDLKTPLTSIITYVDLLKSDNLSDKERNEYLKILDQKSQRLKLLIEDIFEVSKITSGAVQLNIEKVDVATLMKQTLGEFHEKIENSTLDFRLNFLDSNIFVDLDGKKTYRVFENLLSNILKYSLSNTRVYIDMFDYQDKVTIIMKNISAYEMDFSSTDILERFKRGDKSRKTEGNGLGLAIVKSIIDAQNGTINIEIDGDLFKVVIEFFK